MNDAVLGMAIASMSGFGNCFTSDSPAVPVTGESFGDVLSNVSMKNPADVMQAQPVKDMLAQMYGVTAEGESIENASLFDVLKAIGGMQLDDKARETISKLFGNLDSEDFDPEEIADKLVNEGGEEFELLPDSQLPEEWAGMSLEDSEKLLKLIDLMLYAASDKKPYGDKGVEKIFDELFGNNDKDMSEAAAESGNVVESFLWKAIIMSVTSNNTESKEDSEKAIDITMGIGDAAASVQTAANVSGTAGNIAESTANISETAAKGVPEAAEAAFPENEMITIPKGENESPAEMPKTEFIDRLTRLSEALKAEISEKIGDTAKGAVLQENGILQAEKDKMSLFAVKKESVNFAAGEIEALTGVQTAAPDVTEIADSEQFSNISAQIERVIRAEMTAVSSKKTSQVRELNIRLNPEELGEINVKLSTDGKALTVAFTAENSSTAKLLSDNIRSLAAAISRNADSETETTYLIQAADGSESAALNLSTGSSDSFGRGEPQNSGSQPVYREFTPDTDEPADEKILIQEAKLWQTV